MSSKYRKSTNKNLAFKNGETKIKFKFDRNFLNMVIAYIFTKSKSITKANLIAIRKLFDYMDTDMYAMNSDMYARIGFIKDCLECILSKGIERKELVLEYAKKENDREVMDIINNIDKVPAMTLSEIKLINRSIADKLKYAYLIYYKEAINDIFLRMDKEEYKS